MAANRVIRYLLTALVLFGFLFIVLPYLEEAKRMVSVTYQPFPYMKALLLTYAVFGGLIGLFEHTLGEIKKPGKWGLNIEKLVFLGLPAAFFATINYIYFQQYLKLPASIITLTGKIALMGRGLTDVAAVLLGYILVSSVYKNGDRAGLQFRSRS